MLRPKAGERKKFCMSMITSADLLGSSVIGEVVVCTVWFEDLVPLVDAAEGRDKSKPVCEECSQKLELVPMCALRWGEDEVVAMVGGAAL